MTEKLYYKDAYMKEFIARITGISEADGYICITLNATAFYPEGGGQPADTGMLKLPDGRELVVTDVQEDGEEIIHYIKYARPDDEKADDLDAMIEDNVATGADLPKMKDSAGNSELSNQVLIGQEVTGIIDWKRRFDHMQQHSGEHIVSGMICSRFNCDNVGFHMGADIITIDYNARISFEEALEIEAAANEYIWQDHKFKEIWPSPDELQNMEYRSKKALEGNVRITSFSGADTCACCGTHVASSAQVGLVKFLSARSFHDGTRLELLCGKRAMDYLARIHKEGKATAALLSTSEENLAFHVEKLIDDNITLKGDISFLEGKLTEKWAESLKGQRNVLVIEDGLSPAAARKLADALADACSGTTAVFASNGNGYTYSIINRQKDISDFIKKMNAALNGKGGGRNGFAQGSVKADRKSIKQFFEAAAIQ